MNTTSLSVTDIVKGSVVDTFTEQFAALTPLSVIIALVMGFVVGLIIALVYRRTYRGVLYSPSFASTLVMMTLITTPVVMCIKSNIALSMGMVGALSIVRFRTAIKEPVEIVFLFWSLAVGIVIGAGMIPLAVIGSAIIGVILLLFANRKIHNDPYIFVTNCTDENAENAVMDILGKEAEHCVVKSKTVTASGIELTAELRTKTASTAFVNAIAQLPGVETATLVSYNGEYLS